MDEHPPLFPQEELNGLTIPPASFTPIFNPAEIVTHPAPENTQLSLADAAAKYKEMVGVWPNDELSEDAIRKAISSVDAAEAENKRLIDITRLEDQEETRRLYRGA